jgi:DNA repair protein RadC
MPVEPLPVAHQNELGFVVIIVAGVPVVYELFHERFAKADREEFLAVMLDGKNRALGFHVVSVGTLTASLVHPRLCFAKHNLGYVAATVMLSTA